MPTVEGKIVRNDWQSFCDAWTASECVKEVASKLGITVASATARASKYRKLGAELKSMKTGGGRPKLCAEDIVAYVAAKNAELTR